MSLVKDARTVFRILNPPFYVKLYLYKDVVEVIYKVRLTVTESLL